MKRMSASDAKNHWGELTKAVVGAGETVVVENRREPMLVVIPPTDFEEYQTLRREKILREVRESLIRIQDVQLELTRGLSEEDADALIDQVMAEDRADRNRAMSASPSS